MSYAHSILVPGAVGHDDPQALRDALEDVINNHTDAEQRLRSISGVADAVRVELSIIQDQLAHLEGQLDDAVSAAEDGC